MVRKEYNRLQITSLEHLFGLVGFVKINIFNKWGLKRGTSVLLHGRLAIIPASLLALMVSSCFSMYHTRPPMIKAWSDIPTIPEYACVLETYESAEFIKDVEGIMGGDIEGNYMVVKGRVIVPQDMLNNEDPETKISTYWFTYKIKDVRITTVGGREYKRNRKIKKFTKPLVTELHSQILENCAGIPPDDIEFKLKIK